MTLTRPILSSCSCPNRLCRVPYGLCHCGCGRATSIAPVTSQKRGQIKGYPIRFVRGHAVVQPRKRLDDVAAFKLRGVYCRLIPLTNGIYAIVSAEKYEEYSRWHWFAKYYPRQGCYYAARHVAKEYPGRVVYMHRQVLGLQYGDPLIGDHIDTISTTDNSDLNLRIANYTESQTNQGRRRDNTSGYKGVSFGKAKGKWVAQITVYGKYYFLGYYDTPQEAHAAYCEAATRLHGAFARFA